MENPPMAQAKNSAKPAAKSTKQQPAKGKPAAKKGK
jgi:hypothetical protein